MAFLRNETNKHFTIINNYVLQNGLISLKAIGMYAKLISLPDNWKFTEEGLVSICKDGKEAVKSALKELEDINLLFRFRTRDDKGRASEMIYWLSSIPMDEELKKEIKSRYNAFISMPLEEKKQKSVDIMAFSPRAENPLLENPMAEKPIAEKSTLLNTNILNTNILNNKEINKENLQLKKDFETVWDLYPKKQGKANAEKAYIKAIKNGITKEEIINGIKRYVEYIDNNNISQQYIKHGSSWFNQECWNDLYDEGRKSMGKEIYAEDGTFDCIQM